MGVQVSGQESDQPPAATSDGTSGGSPRPRLWPVSGWLLVARQFVRGLWSWQSVRRHWSFVAAGLLALGAYAEAAGALWDIAGWVWPFDHEPTTSETADPADPVDPTATTGSPDTTAGAAASSGTGPGSSSGSPGPGGGGNAGPATSVTPAAPATTPLGRGTPRAMTARSDTVWVVSSDEDLVFRIDAPTGAVEQTEPLDGGPVGVLHAAGDLWVVHETRTVRLDPESLRPRRGESVVGLDEVEGRHVAVAAAPGSGDGGDAGERVWLVTTAGARASVYALAPGRRAIEVEHLVSLVGEPVGMVATTDAVWVAMGDGRVHRVDVETGDSEPIGGIGAPIGAIARHGGDLWLTSPTEGRVYRMPIGSGGGPATPVDLAEVGSASERPPDERVTEPGAVLAVGDVVWVVDRARGTLARVSGPNATVVSTFPSRGREPVALAWTDGVLWTALAGDRAAARTEVPYADGADRPG